MSIEKNFRPDSLKATEQKEKSLLKNTAEFRKALDDDKLEEAASFLTEVISNPDQHSQYDERWLDHRQRELFQAFYKIEDWKGAKKIVEATNDVRSREGRKIRLEELSGLKYEEI